MKTVKIEMEIRPQDWVLVYLLTMSIFAPWGFGFFMILDLVFK